MVDEPFDDELDYEIECVNGIEFIPLSIILKTLPEDKRKAEIERLKKLDPGGYKKYVEFCKFGEKHGHKFFY